MRNTPTSQRHARTLAAYGWLTRRIARGGAIARYGLALLSTLLVTALLDLGGLAVEPANSSLLYLLAVLLTAVVAGLGPGVLASVLGYLLYNFFFVEPRYILAVADPQAELRLLVFLVAALIASSLAGLVRYQANQLAQRAVALESLYALSQATSAQIALDEALPALAATAVGLLSATRCTMLVPVGDELRQVEHGVAAVPAGSTATTVLRVADRIVGSMQLQLPAGRSLTREEEQLLATLANQAALVVERARLSAQSAEREALAAADQFKTTLLSSLSHDLRTPLAVITGIATALREGEDVWDSPRGAQMLEVLADEAARLNRLVGNLLDMSRIESGALHPERAWEDLGDITGGVLARLRPRLAGRPLRVAVAPDLPLVWVNAALVDQVLTNLLENVLTHTPAGTGLAIGAVVQGDALWVTVDDGGPGIAAQVLPHLFEVFSRGAGPERATGGTGLGLAICRGIVMAHGGQIWAQNRPEGGARFTFTLPLYPAGAPPPPEL